MRKSLILATTVLLSAGLFSCGGGGGGSDSSSNERVVTKVEASVVKGATVCVENTDNCKQTDDNGTAILEVSKLPVKLVIKIGNLTLGSVEANDTYVSVMPTDIANEDNQTAEKIGALIHAIVGDVDDNFTVVDLTGKEIAISEQIDEPLVELLKDGNFTEVKITVKDSEGKEHSISLDNSSVKYDGTEVK
jgi:hypothetical protein